MKNNEMEMCVLGALMGNPADRIEILTFATEDFFQENHNKTIYREIRTLTEAGQPVDQVLLAHHLEAKKLLSKVGGRAYLSDCVASVITPDIAIQYAKILREQAGRRSVGSLGEVAIKLSEREDMPLNKIIDAVGSSFTEITEYIEPTEDEAKSGTQEFLDWRERHKDSPDGLFGYSTGLEDLDRMTGGLQKSHVWSVGAYRGQGKSFFALHLLWQAANQGARCLLFSLEMSKGENVRRLVAMDGGLEDGELFEDKATEHIKAVAEVEGAGFLTIHTGIDTVERIEMELMRRDQAEGVDLVIVDYVQLLQGDGSNYEVLSRSVKRLQQMAIRYNCAMVLVSQINNEAQKAGSTRRVDGFLGAGEIGQVANVAIFLEREKITEGEDADKLTDDLTLRLAKVRHGQGGRVFAKFEFPGGQIRPAKGYEIKELLKKQAESRKRPGERAVDKIFNDV